jgi:hypothetical protein
MFATYFGNSEKIWQETCSMPATMSPQANSLSDSKIELT